MAQTALSTIYQIALSIIIYFETATKLQESVRNLDIHVQLLLNFLSWAQGPLALRSYNSWMSGQTLRFGWSKALSITMFSLGKLKGLCKGGLQVNHPGNRSVTLVSPKPCKYLSCLPGDHWTQLLNLLCHTTLTASRSVCTQFCLEIMSIFVGLRGTHVCMWHLKLGSNVHLLHFYKIDELEKTIWKDKVQFEN